MKNNSKKAISLFLCATMILAGCSNNTVVETEETTTATTTTTTTTTTQATTTTAETTTTTVTTTLPPEPKSYSFNIGDTVTVNSKYDVTMKYFDFTYKVEPSNPDGYYSYYEVQEDDTIYYHVVFDVRNLKGNSVSADEIIEATLTYDNVYNYYGFSTIEEEGGSDFTYTSISSIDPLETRTIHYIISVPSEVATSGKEILLTLEVDDETLECTGVVGSENVVIGKTDNNTLKNTNWQSYTPLEIGTLITVDGYADITPLEANFAYKITPPNPDGYYSYYEVKEQGKIYAHISFRIKNIKPTSLAADEALGVTLLYDNIYTYRAFSTIEEDGGSDFGYTSLNRIDPLTSGVIHYIIEVPEEVSTSGNPAVIIVNANGEKYYYQLV